MAQAKHPPPTRTSDSSSAGRPVGEERRIARRTTLPSTRPSKQEAAQQEHLTRDYVTRLASDKQASVNFLKEAGILDARGSLAKPYRG